MNIKNMAATTVYLWEQYKQLMEQVRKIHPLKIVDFFYHEDEKEVYFVIKVFGKNVPLQTVSARALYENDQFLENFSQVDVKKIVSTVLGSTVRVEAITFKASKTLFKLTNMLTKKNHSSEAKDIFQDRELLYSLSKESIGNIAYQAGLDTSDS